MATQIGDLAVKVGADVSGLTGGLKKGESAVTKFRGRLNSSIGSLTKFTAATAAAGAALGIHMVRQGLAAVDAQAKMAQQLNTTSKSMATLQRAGELSGVTMNTINTASRTLAVRIGEAQQGLASAADAFDALQINAEDLANLPLDQRIQTINEALRNNVDASERAAIAADLFGTRASTAIQMLQGNVLEQAAREAELFGLALSDVDAAKVEMANDAMSTMGKALQGVQQQLAVQLAPILKAVGEGFINMAEEAGGVGPLVRSGVNEAVDALASAADAVFFVKQGFEALAKGVLLAFQGVGAAVINTFATIVEGWTELANLLPGIEVDYESTFFGKLQREVNQGLSDMAQDLHETLMEPLPGDAIRAFAEEAIAAGEAAAEAAVQARDAAAEVVPGGAAMNPELEAELEKLRELGISKQELLLEQQAAELEIIRQGLEAKALTEEEAQQLERDARARHQQAMTELDAEASEERARLAQMEARARNQAVGKMFADLRSLTSSESRKMFEVGKAAAIGQTVLDTYSGAQAAFSALAGIPIVGPALGTAAALAAIAAGTARVQAIRSQQFGGGGGVSAAGGGAGGANTGAAPVPAQAQTQGEEGGRNLFVRGINPNDLFSGQQLVDLINEAQADGAQLVLGGS